MISLALRRGLPSYLGVTKRHRPDKFLLSHAVDGFSAALDFKVTDWQSRPVEQDASGVRPNRARGRRALLLCQEQRDTRQTAASFLGSKTIAEFRRLKKRCDPDGVLQSNLYRRVFAPERGHRQLMEHFDVIVIGSGPAGEKGAEQAAQFGKRVALIERAEHLGGAGINTGTVPSKTLRETALYFSGLQQRGLYGIDYSLRRGLSVREFMHREHVVVRNERRIISRNIRELDIARFHGTASLEDRNRVRVARSRSSTGDYGGTSS